MERSGLRFDNFCLEMVQNRRAGILYYFSLHMFSMYYTFLQCIRHLSNVLYL